MPPISLLGVVDELMNQLPTLLEQVLKTEIENRAVTSQCIDMEKQIQELQKEVVQEQTKQKKLKERLVTVQSQTRRRAECNLGSSNSSALANRQQRSSNESSPMSMRNKRKERLFEEETNKTTPKRVRFDKENHWRVDSPHLGR